MRPTQHRAPTTTTAAAAAAAAAAVVTSTSHLLILGCERMGYSLGDLTSLRQDHCSDTSIQYPRPQTSIRSPKVRMSQGPEPKDLHSRQPALPPSNPPQGAAGSPGQGRRQHASALACRNCRVPSAASRGCEQVSGGRAVRLGAVEVLHGFVCSSGALRAPRIRASLSFFPRRARSLAPAGEPSPPPLAQVLILDIANPQITNGAFIGV